MKRICLLLALLLMLPMASQANAGDAGFYRLDSMSDDEMTLDSDTLRELGLDWHIILREDGSAEAQFDGHATGTWQDGSITLEADGDEETLAYSIADGLMSISLGTETIYLRREDEGEAPPPAVTPVAADGGGTPLQQWWAGDWYGYWEISGVTDRYEQLDDGRWDCYAAVDLAADGTGALRLWDNESAILTTNITVTESGGAGVMGAAVSEDGHYGDGAAISHADLIIDPSLYGYDNYMVIDGYFESADDPDEGFYYWVYLRPWGLAWDDIPEDMRPPRYEDWYLRESTRPMLEAVADLGGDTGPAPEAVADAPPEAVPALRAVCPEGWTQFTVESMMDDGAAPNALEFRKDITDEDDRYLSPGLIIYFQADLPTLPIPSRDLLGDPVPLAPMETGGRAWQGINGEWLGERRAVLWTEGGEKALEITVYLENTLGKITLDDADVLSIMESIAF